LDNRIVQGFLQEVACDEKRIGEEQGAEAVKAKAIERTQRAAAHSAGDEV